MTESAASVVVPIIAVDSVDTAYDFYVDKLGFRRHLVVFGDDGWFDLAIVQLGGARLMFTRSHHGIDAARPLETGGQVEIYVQVPDVDSYLGQLRARGVNCPAAPTMQAWGDRTFNVVDPYGRKLWFGSGISGRPAGESPEALRYASR